MNIQSIILLAVVLVCAAFSLYRYLRRDGKCSRCGDCCSEECSCCDQRKQNL